MTGAEMFILIYLLIIIVHGFTRAYIMPEQVRVQEIKIVERYIDILEFNRDFSISRDELDSIRRYKYDRYSLVKDEIIILDLIEREKRNFLGNLDLNLIKIHESPKNPYRDILRYRLSIKILPPLKQ